MIKTIGEAEFNAQKLRIDELLEFVQALTKMEVDLETKNNAKAKKINAKSRKNPQMLKASKRRDQRLTSYGRQ